VSRDFELGRSVGREKSLPSVLHRANLLSLTSKVYCYYILKCLSKYRKICWKISI